MSNKKPIEYLAPLGMNSYPTPPPPPPLKPIETELITNKFFGNFLTTGKPLPPPQTLELWRSDGKTFVAGTVSISNSSDSTHAISIQIISEMAHHLTALPGNTVSFTGNALQSISIIDIPADSSTHIEGKYCCHFTYGHKKNDSA